MCNIYIIRAFYTVWLFLRGLLIPWPLTICLIYLVLGDIRLIFADIEKY